MPFLKTWAYEEELPREEHENWISKHPFTLLNQIDSLECTFSNAPGFLMWNVKLLSENCIAVQKQDFCNFGNNHIVNEITFGCRQVSNAKLIFDKLRHLNSSIVLRK